MKTQEKLLEVMTAILVCIVIVLSIIYRMPYHIPIINGLILAYIIEYYRSEDIYLDDEPLSDFRVTSFILLIVTSLSLLMRFNIVAIICLIAVFYIGHYYEKQHYRFLAKIHEIENEISYSRIFLSRALIGLSFTLFLVLTRHELAYYDYLINLLFPLSFASLLSPFPNGKEVKIQQENAKGHFPDLWIFLSITSVLVLLLLAKTAVTFII